MNVAIAAGYCGEPSIGSFLRHVGIYYPKPIMLRGRPPVWDKTAVDEAIDSFSRTTPVDAADVL
jgi:hypothetical protein